MIRRSGDHWRLEGGPHDHDRYMLTTVDNYKTTVKYLNISDRAEGCLGSRQSCKGDQIYGAVVTYSQRPGFQKVEVVRVD